MSLVSWYTTTVVCTLQNIQLVWYPYPECPSVHSSTTALVQKLAKENEDAAAVVRKASIVVGATGNRCK